MVWTILRTFIDYMLSLTIYHPLKKEENSSSVKIKWTYFCWQTIQISYRKSISKTNSECYVTTNLYFMGYRCLHIINSTYTRTLDI